MPIVHIDLMEGRSPDRIEAMIRSVSQAIATSLEAPIDSVRVVVREMAPHHYGVGGRPWPEVVAERETNRGG
jgi:4-oxalocrotonate tautomerase